MKNSICRQIVVTTTLLLLIIASLAQYPNVMMSNYGSPEEPSIFINPKNKLQIIAASNIDWCYHSNDGGLTWTRSKLTSSYGVWGDPCIIADTAGHFYFFHLSNPSFGNWIDRIVCQKTTDGGVTWNDGSYTFLNGTKAQDKEWAVVDPVTNYIYVTWTQFDVYGSASPLDSSYIMFARSTDGGASWDEVKRINQIAGDCIDSDNTVEGAVPAVGQNGEIYVSWMGPSGLVFDKSTDYGVTWLNEDIVIGDVPGGWDITIPGIMRCNGMPVTCCDLSNSPNRGTIYINWSDQRNGSHNTDVWLIKSTDGGNTWSQPARVNDDTTERHQFFTWMAIDQITGYLYFVFYDRRNYANSNTDVYMAVSKDGGNTFTNFKVSESPFLPTASVFFGDYNNIAAHNNVIRPIWTRLHQGVLSVWTAIVDGSTISVSEKDYCEDDENNAFPNPFIDETNIVYKLRRASTVSIIIYDVFGKPVLTLKDKVKMLPGKYIDRFIPEQYQLPAGIYHYKVFNDEKNWQGKLFYSK